MELFRPAAIEGIAPLDVGGSLIIPQGEFRQEFRRFHPPPPRPRRVLPPSVLTKAPTGARQGEQRGACVSAAGSSAVPRPSLVTVGAGRPSSGLDGRITAPACRDKATHCAPPTPPPPVR